MNKEKLISAIKAQIEKDLSVLKEAALIAYEAATNEESRPENEYDTRALEASYIAGAQSKRAADLEELLSVYKYLELKKFHEKSPISSTALVGLEHDGKFFYAFLMSKGGGMNLNVDGKQVQVITPSSPLGEALLGLQCGDTALVEVGATTLEYDIISIE